MSDNKDKKPVINLPDNVAVDYLFEKMIKSFIKQVQKEGILQEVKDRRYYVKPSALKRAKGKEKRR